MAEYVYLFCYPTGRQVREIAPNKTAAIIQHREKTQVKLSFLREQVKIINLGRRDN